MAHCRILFVGTINNLNTIYADCPDSSSESTAEMAFGADWISEEDDGEFMKCHENFSQILNKQWCYCFDIRDPKNYGDYCCVNNLPFEEERNIEAENYNRDLCVESIKHLPDDTIFFFANSHW